MTVSDNKVIGAGGMNFKLRRRPSKVKIISKVNVVVCLFLSLGGALLVFSYFSSMQNFYEISSAIKVPSVVDPILPSANQTSQSLDLKSLFLNQGDGGKASTFFKILLEYKYGPFPGTVSRFLAKTYEQPKLVSVEVVEDSDILIISVGTQNLVNGKVFLKEVINKIEEKHKERVEQVLGNISEFTSFFKEKHLELFNLKRDLEKAKNRMGYSPVILGQLSRVGEMQQSLDMMLMNSGILHKSSNRNKIEILHSKLNPKGPKGPKSGLLSIVVFFVLFGMSINIIMFYNAVLRND